jgi:hypothetical protein
MPLVGTGQQLDVPAQSDQMVAQYGFELAAMPETELAQQGSDRRWRVHRIEQCLHPAASHEVDIIDTVGAGAHPSDQGGQFRGRVSRPGFDPGFSDVDLVGQQP